MIYAGDIPSWCNEQEGTYTEFFVNPTGYVFLAPRRDHEFQLSHRGTISHVSKTSIESIKSNCDYIENSNSS